MQIKDMPVSERPQEKLLFAGAGALSNSELLALIIRTGTSSKSAVQLAEDVIAYAASSAGGLSQADARELTQVDGIGEAKACSIIAAIELSKRLMAEHVMESSPTLSSCEDVAALLAREMLYEKRELFMTINLNTKMKVQSKDVISVGSLDKTLVHPREVFSPALKKGAAAVIVAHNHPSGDPEPSQLDISVTERLLATSKIIGIRLIDHVIVGNGKYASMRDMGLVEGL